ncbi:MAG TPA: PEFG-CTERM sorting domain-containing protein [Candidatus Nitrosotenuis sp.]|nr:PEFG-CTERM sorting domain-containing protein [Candidatus Nitrosotenuis sp.]
MTNAYAHKSEVIGDYKVEVGWDVEPPISGINNKITVLITYASSEEKLEATTDDGMTHKYGEGVSGLASNLDVMVTLNKEKTELTLVEDEAVPGLYIGEFTPPTEGYPIVHLFADLKGQIIEVDFHPERVEDGAMIKTVTSDGSINVDLIATAPKLDRWMLIKAQFINDQGNLIDHINYNIVATQNGKQVLSTSSHSHSGDAKHTTEILSSSDPVDIQIKILGIGLPEDEVNWSGPIGETISLSIVPEFGTFVMLVLTTAIMSIVLMGSKIMQRLNYSN